MTLKSTSEAYSSSGCHGGAFSISSSVALANIASAAVVDTATGSSEGTWPSVCSTSPRFPPIVDLAEGCWAGSRCLASPPLVNAINQGGRSTISRISTNADRCRPLIRPSGEWRRADIGCYNLIVRRSEFGVA